MKSIQISNVQCGVEDFSKIIILLLLRIQATHMSNLVMQQYCTAFEYQRCL